MENVMDMEFIHLTTIKNTKVLLKIIKGMEKENYIYQMVALCTMENGVMIN